MPFKAQLFDVLHASQQVEIYDLNGELIGLNEGFQAVGDSVRLYHDEQEWDLPDQPVEVNDGWCSVRAEQKALLLLKVLMCRPITEADLAKPEQPS